MSTSRDRARARRRTLAAVLVTGTAAVTLGGCVIGTTDDDAATGPTVVTVTGTTPRPTVGDSAGQSDPAAPTGASGTTDPTATGPGAPGAAPGPDAQIGTGYSYTYLDGGTPVTGGTLDSLPVPGPVAWSTSKVPVAVAALRAVDDGTSLSDAATVQDNVTAAITTSDNAAAQALWDSLGDPATAGAETEAVLREAGDTTTRVQTAVTRPGLTSFGQTSWTTTDQARFAAGLTCIPGAGPVVAAMGRITAGQDYGLGRLPGAVFKGGWGPDPAGAYQVRQFGLVSGADGTRVPVAVEVVSPDGTYEAGIAALDALVDHLGGVLAGAHGVATATC